MKNRPLKFVLELFIPVILLVIYYIIADPYKIIWHYDAFFPEVGTSYVGLDHDYVSVATFDNYNDSLHYNSFIFGNSRSRYYQVVDWKKHLDSTAVCYHMDASNETLEGIYLKLKYVSERALINNCLLVLDTYILSETKTRRDNLIFFPAPQTTPERDNLKFWITGFKSFVSPKFFYAYTKMLLFGQVSKEAAEEGVLDVAIRHYDYRWNETTWPEKEKSIVQGTYYQGKVMHYFKERPDTLTYAQQCIFEEQEGLLKDIADILLASGVNYKIIISPGYDQLKLSIEDYIIMCSIFGSDNVFDFSGENELTEDYNNYYDISHYRPFVAAKIMDSVYAN